MTKLLHDDLDRRLILIWDSYYQIEEDRSCQYQCYHVLIGFKQHYSLAPAFCRTGTQHDCGYTTGYPELFTILDLVEMGFIRLCQLVGTGGCHMATRNSCSTSFHYSSSPLSMAIDP